MVITNLLDQLKRDEGEVLHVYLDSRGIRTAGVGHNLEAHNIPLAVGTVITQQQSDAWLAEDILVASNAVSIHIPWSNSLDDIRKAVLQNMCFNMGIMKLLGFHLFLADMQNGQYKLASIEMLHSAWAIQVGDRSTRLSVQISLGQWQ